MSDTNSVNVKVKFDAEVQGLQKIVSILNTVNSGKITDGMGAIVAAMSALAQIGDDLKKTDINSQMTSQITQIKNLTTTLSNAYDVLQKASIKSNPQKVAQLSRLGTGMAANAQNELDNIISSMSVSGGKSILGRTLDAVGLNKASREARKSMRLEAEKQSQEDINQLNTLTDREIKAQERAEARKQKNIDRLRDREIKRANKKNAKENGWNSDNTLIDKILDPILGAFDGTNKRKKDAIEDQKAYQARLDAQEELTQQTIEENRKREVVEDEVVENVRVREERKRNFRQKTGETDEQFIRRQEDWQEKLDILEFNKDKRQDARDAKIEEKEAEAQERRLQAESEANYQIELLGDKHSKVSIQKAEDAIKRINIAINQLPKKERAEFASEMAESLKEAGINAEMFGNRLQLVVKGSQKLESHLMATVKQMFSMERLVSRVSFVITATASYRVMGFVQSLIPKALAKMREFEDEMTKTYAIMQSNTDAEKKWLGEAVIDNALKYGVALGEVTDAIYEVISASIPYEHAMDVMNAAQQLSIGGFSNLKDAVLSISTILNAYNLDPSRAGHIADVAFQTTKYGIIKASQYTQEMSKILSTAAEFEVPIEEVSAAIATMTKNGVKANMAFTSLNQLLFTIANPSEKAKKTMDAYGVSIDMNTVRTKGLMGALLGLGKVLDSEEAMTDVVKSRTGARALMSLVSNSSEMGQMMNRMTFESAGVAEEAANLRMMTSQRLLNQLTVAWNNLFRVIGEKGKGIYNGTLRNLTSFLTFATKHVEGIAKIVQFIVTALATINIQKKFNTWSSILGEKASEEGIGGMESGLLRVASSASKVTGVITGWLGVLMLAYQIVSGIAAKMLDKKWNSLYSKELSPAAGKTIDNQIKLNEQKKIDIENTFKLFQMNDELYKQRNNSAAQLEYYNSLHGQAIKQVKALGLAQIAGATTNGKMIMYQTEMELEYQKVQKESIRLQQDKQSWELAQKAKSVGRNLDSDSGGNAVSTFAKNWLNSFNLNFTKTRIDEAYVGSSVSEQQVEKSLIPDAKEIAQMMIDFNSLNSGEIVYGQSSLVNGQMSLGKPINKEAFVKSSIPRLADMIEKYKKIINEVSTPEVIDRLAELLSVAYDAKAYFASTTSDSLSETISLEKLTKTMAKIETGDGRTKRDAPDMLKASQELIDAFERVTAHDVFDMTAIFADKRKQYDEIVAQFNKESEDYAKDMKWDKGSDAYKNYMASRKKALEVGLPAGDTSWKLASVDQALTTGMAKFKDVATVGDAQAGSKAINKMIYDMLKKIDYGSLTAEQQSAYLIKLEEIQKQMADIPYLLLEKSLSNAVNEQDRKDIILNMFDAMPKTAGKEYPSSQALKDLYEKGTSVMIETFVANNKDLLPKTIETLFLEKAKQNIQDIRKNLSKFLGKDADKLTSGVKSFAETFSGLFDEMRKIVEETGGKFDIEKLKKMLINPDGSVNTAKIDPNSGQFKSMIGADKNKDIDPKAIEDYRAVIGSLKQSVASANLTPRQARSILSSDNGDVYDNISSKMDDKAYSSKTSRKMIDAMDSPEGTIALDTLFPGASSYTTGKAIQMVQAEFMKTMDSMWASYYERRVKMAQAHKDAQLKILEDEKTVGLANENLSAEQKLALQAKYEERKRKLTEAEDKKIAKAKKKQTLAQMDIEFAKSIAYIWAGALSKHGTLGVPEAIGLTALLSAMFLSNRNQVAQTSEDSFYKGGYTGSGTGEKDESGYRVAGKVHEGELVIDKKTMDNNFIPLMNMYGFLRSGGKFDDFMANQSFRGSKQANLVASGSFAGGGYAAGQSNVNVQVSLGGVRTLDPVDLSVMVENGNKVRSRRTIK